MALCSIFAQVFPHDWGWDSLDPQARRWKRSGEDQLFAFFRRFSFPRGVRELNACVAMPVWAWRGGRKCLLLRGNANLSETSAVWHHDGWGKSMNPTMRLEFGTKVHPGFEFLSALAIFRTSDLELGRFLVLNQLFKLSCFTVRFYVYTRPRTIFGCEKKAVHLSYFQF